MKQDILIEDEWGIDSLFLEEGLSIEDSEIYSFCRKVSRISYLKGSIVFMDNGQLTARIKTPFKLPSTKELEIDIVKISDGKIYKLIPYEWSGKYKKYEKEVDSLTLEPCFLIYARAIFITEWKNDGIIFNENCEILSQIKYRALLPRKFSICFQEKTDQYEKRFSGEEIGYLKSEGISPEETSLYDERFDGLGVICLIKEGITPEETDLYDRRFSGGDISEFKQERISPEEANLYNERFWAYDILTLKQNNISYKEADLYDERFDGEEIVLLKEKNISPEEARLYNKRVSIFEIIKLEEIRNSVGETK